MPFSPFTMPLCELWFLVASLSPPPHVSLAHFSSTIPLHFLLCTVPHYLHACLCTYHTSPPQRVTHFHATHCLAPPVPHYPATRGYLYTCSADMLPHHTFCGAAHLYNTYHTFYFDTFAYTLPLALVHLPCLLEELAHIFWTANMATRAACKRTAAPSPLSPSISPWRALSKTRHALTPTALFVSANEPPHLRRIRTAGMATVCRTYRRHNLRAIFALRNLHDAFALSPAGPYLTAPPSTRYFSLRTRVAAVRLNDWAMPHPHTFAHSEP